MKLYAKKPCSFNGKRFFIGDEIPENFVLDPKAQMSMGIIEVVGENGATRPESESADSNEGGILLPPSSTLENTEVQQEPEKKYTKGALTHMTKENILAIANEKGVEATEEMTKEQIADLIIEKQGE